MLDELYGPSIAIFFRLGIRKVLNGNRDSVLKENEIDRAGRDVCEEVLFIAPDYPEQKHIDSIHRIRRFYAEKPQAEASSPRWRISASLRNPSSATAKVGSG